MNIRKITLTIAAATAMSIAVVSCKPKDSDIKAKVETALAAPSMMVDVKDGVATISGEAANEEERTALEAKVKEVKGVKSIVNNITVAAPVVVADDAALTQAVNDAIKDFPTVKATVANGVVTLSGEATKDQNMKITQAIMSAKPKDVNRDNFTVK